MSKFVASASRSFFSASPFNKVVFKTPASSTFKLTVQEYGQRNYGDSAASTMVKDASAGILTPPRGRVAETMDFNKLFPDIVRDLTEDSAPKDEVVEARKWFAKVLQYNLTGGSRERGLSVVESFRILSGNSFTQESLRQAQYLGWCVEMLHTSIILREDKAIGAKTRRGKDCWYLVNDFGDAPRTLEAGVFRLLNHHFSNHPAYVSIIELFHNACSRAVLGQALDMEAMKDKSRSHFTMDRFKAIVKYKVAPVTFQLPVSLAMILCDIHDPEVHRQGRTILLETALFTQAHKDFVNCYGPRDKMYLNNKTDIENGKCTWLAVVALQRATPFEAHLFKESYGYDSENNVKIIKGLYNAIGIPSTFRQYKEHTYDLLCTQIQQISRGLPHKLYYRFLKALLKN